MKGCTPMLHSAGFARAVPGVMACGEKFAYVDTCKNPDIPPSCPSTPMADFSASCGLTWNW